MKNCLSRGRALMIPLLSLLCACTSFSLHDESRAKLAADSQKEYADAKVVEVIEVDYKNLELLLGEEIKAVRDNNSLNVDFAALEIANNTTPMGRTYQEAQTRINKLGVNSSMDVRTLLNDDIKQSNARRKLKTAEKVFRAKGFPPPDCAGLPSELKPPSTMSEENIKLLKKIYPNYREVCAEWIKTMEHGSHGNGLMSRAHLQWQDAEDALIDKKKEQKLAQDKIAGARKAFDEAVEKGAAPKKKAQDISDDIAKKSEDLSKALEDAKKLGLGVENEAHVDALIELLTAAAGGEVNPQNPTVARATVILKAIPSLALDVGEIESKKTAPPVSGLLMALRHQTLLAEAAKKRTALAEERVTVLKGKYDAIYGEAEHWLHFTDAMCSYAFLSDKKPFPALKCNTFKADDKGKCSQDNNDIANCVLEQPWKVRIRASDEPAAKRELYKAIQHYFQALALQGAPVEQTYREIDIRHRETLLAKQSALEGWDILVGVPLDQLNAYYQGGVKPAEIADLIVKALGFSAVAIGVSK